MAHVYLLIVVLLVLLLLSAFFSGSETGIMSINRYKLKHLSQENKGAQRVLELLQRPDRLLGVILLGNNFVNILASSLASYMAVKLMGDLGVVIASMVLTIVILIFAEVSPKTLAAIYPEKIAFPASWILQILLKVLYPVVVMVNYLSNGFLGLFGIKIKHSKNHTLSAEELRSVILEESNVISDKNQSMLLGILDLERVAVEDIMVPYHEIVGIDLSNDWDLIKNQLSTTQHSFLPVYKNDLNDLVGILHIKNIYKLTAIEQITKEKFINILDECYFIPNNTPLTTQLINFQKNNKKFALVVNEYGDIQGLLTLADILEEIVGEFTTNFAETTTKNIHPQPDGSFLVNGSIMIRELNKELNIELPSDEAKTLSGLIINYLQMIPNTGTCCKINEIPMEVMQVFENRIKTIKVFPEYQAKDND